MSYREVNPCQNNTLALASMILKSHLASNRENARQLLSSYICKINSINAKSILSGLTFVRSSGEKY